jgi:hypothetical protein
MEHRPLIERLARHLAATPEDWPARVEDAASILAILKQPDSAMMAAGDAAAWEKMIDAALRERWTVTPPAADADPPAGADEEGEIRLSADAVGDNRADWVHLQKTQERSA